MPQYRKYTTCVKATDFTPSPLSSAAVAATWLILLAVAIVSAAALAVVLDQIVIEAARPRTSEQPPEAPHVR